MTELRMFSDSTGLEVNNSKCSVYFRGVLDETGKEIMGEATFCKGKLTFKYLGVPLDSKKHAINKFCQGLRKSPVE